MPQILNRLIKTETSLLVTIFILSGLFSSCISEVSMQTGRTLGIKKLEVCVNGSSGKFSEISAIDSAGSFDYKPLIGVNLHYGVLKNLNVGVSVNQSTFIGTSMKYQLLGTKQSRFATSLGLNAGFNSGAFLFGNFISFLSVPLYISYHPSNAFSVYLTPRYIATSEYIFASETGSQEIGFNRKIYRIGSSYGIMVGEEHKIAIEVSNFGKALFRPTQISVGYIYTFGEK
jgi:hypothetical protein